MMRFSSWLSFLIAIVSTCTGGGDSHGVIAQETGEQILHDVLKYRQNISHGEVILRTLTWYQGNAERERQWHIWFDGDKLRGDTTVADVTEVSCIGCIAVENAIIRYRNDRPNGMPMALTVHDVTSVNPVSFNVPSVRWLGLFSSDVMNAVYYHPEVFYAPSNTPTVTSVKFREWTVKR